MEVEKPSGEERKESSHMTMKPVRLMEHLVRIFTKEGSTVLDPFMGSGSTGVACVHTGRKFFGIELSPKYFGEAKARLEKHIGEKNGQ
jgi:site-specific DNA-methyltransferase (adenine-specific)